MKSHPTASSRRVRIDVTGTVQGIGFRPFVYRLATSLGLSGYVLNHDRGVTIELQGSPDVVQRFLDDMPKQAPPASRIDATVCTELPAVQGDAGFSIRESLQSSGAKYVPISPDLTVCEDCLREIFDPSDRRYYYPFTNCTNCGPRFTIVKDVPYDRPKTTMSSFPMCERCRAEYGNPLDRRFHAQPNACPVCGPRLELTDEEGRAIATVDSSNPAVIRHCARLLTEGKILAIKSLGGFHLACDAANDNAVRTLRLRKQREDKPLAVMCPDLASARAITRISEAEEQLLRSRARPIVLLEKSGDVAPSVAPKNRYLGVMLPYTPLHALLLREFGRALVMTSGNLTEEPIAFSNAEALTRLGSIADFFLLNDRDIHIRCDDSVVRSFRNRPFFFRRSRGYVPESIALSQALGRPVLGVGAQLKNTFCIAKDTHAHLSHHIGDLENLATLESLAQGIRHFEALFNIRPDIVAHDLHPDYLSTKWVHEHFNGTGWKDRIFAVQHHHAHIAACIEENGVESDRPIIGLALDGTGYGPDGTIWGGEVLLADRRDYVRAARLRPVPLPGGDHSIRHPWRTALAYLSESAPLGNLPQTGSGSIPPSLRAIAPTQRAIIEQMVGKRLNSPLTSSCGRLFDGVSALAGICIESRYEGQAAIELERALPGDASLPMSPTADAAYEFGQDTDLASDLLELDWRPAISRIARDAAAGVGTGEISRRFHNGLIFSLAATIGRVARRHGLDRPERSRRAAVALSGGCFLNEYLRTNLVNLLESRGFQVLFHVKVPTNDGAISFGQVVVANQMAEGASSCVWQFR